MTLKCLVVDLDGTLWDGVIGEVGRSGIKPNIPLQRQLLELKESGIILAVASKNDLDSALAGLTHPDTILKREHFALFFANWNDKAKNILDIARMLGIGLETIMFLDDSAFERSLVRHVLPMVAVPELYDDDWWLPRPMAIVTAEDKSRTDYYVDNWKREMARAVANSVEEFIDGLEQRLTWRRFDADGFSRILQLVNKTNQFNLTTRRYTAQELAAANGYQFWLADKFGDQGMIGVIIVEAVLDWTVRIDAWLMSCRVIGRGVEKMMFEALVQDTRDCGFTSLAGEYRPTSRNGIVKDHYTKLGFKSLGDNFYGYDLRPDSRDHSQSAQPAGSEANPEH